MNTRCLLADLQPNFAPGVLLRDSMVKIFRVLLCFRASVVARSAVRSSSTTLLLCLCALW
jgi:hypothetical protein